MAARAVVRARRGRPRARRRALPRTGPPRGRGPARGLLPHRRAAPAAQRRLRPCRRPHGRQLLRPGARRGLRLRGADQLPRRPRRTADSRLHPPPRAPAGPGRADPRRRRRPWRPLRVASRAAGRAGRAAGPGDHGMRQLLVYGFDADARFEGRLVGALERMESGDALRIVETWFVTRDAESGEIAAVELRSRGAGSLVAPLIDFRLDPSARRKATAKVDAGVRELGATLEPGEALAAVLVEHRWAHAVENAVAESGGRPPTNALVDAETPAELRLHLPEGV